MFDQYKVKRLTKTIDKMDLKLRKLENLEALKEFKSVESIANLILLMAILRPLINTWRGYSDEEKLQFRKPMSKLIDDQRLIFWVACDQVSKDIKILMKAHDMNTFANSIKM